MSIARQFYHYITEGNQWWFVFLSVLTIFIISPLINLDFLNVLKIEHKTAIYVVDQRTANIATIVSITLVVVGFILNNLAVKKPLVFGLLFKKSLLYPIIYLTLSVIGIFITISTLRDTIQPFQFTRVVLVGTYFAILILFLIGMLFRKVLLFSSEKEIDKMLDEELMFEAKQNLKQILLLKYSEDIFVSTLQEKGAKEYNWSYAWGMATQINLAENVGEIENTIMQKEVLLHDLNLVSLSNFIESKKNTGQILFQKLRLDKIITDIDNFIWVQNKENTQNDKNILKSCLVVKANSNKQKDNDDLRNFFDEKLELLSNQDNHRGIEQILESYLKLYKLQMQNQK